MSTISVRWQTVIPREIRRALDLQARSKLEWELRDGVVVVRPIPANPIRAARGLIRGHGLTTGDLLDERNRDRTRKP